MDLKAITQKINNSLAYRFNKFFQFVQPHFNLSLNNKKFKVPLISNFGEPNIRLKDNYSWLTQVFQSLKLPADTDFLDIGANVGQTLLVFRSLYENQYWGFEPNANCNFYLGKLIKENGFKKVSILPVGLAARNVVAKFYLQHEFDTGASIVDNLRPGAYQPEQVLYVPVFSLDELQLTVNPISLIKIDVEGAELEVISGMSETIQKNQPAILCEVLDYHSAESREMVQNRANQLVELIKKLHYKIYRIVNADNKIVYEPMDAITLVQWTEASFDLNDYLFLPETKTAPAITESPVKNF